MQTIKFLALMLAVSLASYAVGVAVERRAARLARERHDRIWAHIEAQLRK